jgi:hypothetical protein
MPAGLCEADDAPAPHREAFSDQKLGFQLRRAAEAPETAPCGDDPVVGEAGFIGPAHDLADGPRGAGPSSPFGDIPIGGDPARRNAPKHVQHFARERRRGHAR